VARKHTPNGSLSDRDSNGDLVGGRRPRDSAAAVLALQRSAGNQAVARLLRHPGARMLARSPGAVSVSVIPTHKMSGSEFATLVDAQLLGIDESEAAGRQDDLGSSDPHFKAGVTEVEAGKPITVDVRLPAPTESEAADVQARAAELAGFDDSERKAVDAEADRRFWDKRGVAAGTKAAGAADQELWQQSRDEVVRDRNRVDSLPAAVRAVVAPAGTHITPDRYADALRVGHKLESFTWEDWALFQRRGGLDGKTDLGASERKIDAALKIRAGERKIIDRIRGTERLYHLVLRFQVARQMGMKPAQYKQFKDYQPMLDQLAADGFASVAEYESATAEYFLLFRSRAVEIANLAMQASESVVNGEIRRYGDAAGRNQIFNDLAPVRVLIAQYESEIHGDGTGAGADAPRATYEAAEAERQRLAKTYPSLADPEIDLLSLAAATPAALGEVLVRNSKDRLANIEKTRKRIEDKPDVALALDRVVGLTRQELDARDDSVQWMIVAQHLADVANREAFTQQALILLSLGVGMLTFGTGTPVVLGLAGGLAIGSYQAYDEWEKYAAADAAAHTSLDPTQSLASHDPTIAWFAFALLGVGLDAAMLGKALLAAKPAIAALEAGASVTEFSRLLKNAKQVTPEVQAVLDEVAAARRDFSAAVSGLAAKVRRASMLWDPTMVVDFAKMAWHAARIGIRKFDVFLEVLKAEKAFLKTLDLEALTAEQLAELKSAFRQGVREFDATRPSLTVPFTKGAKQLTFADEMLLDGKPVGARARDDVMKQLDLTHTDRGHGAFRDPRTIANEALQNATKPRGAGMAAQWASDEAMLESLQTAQRRLKTGAGVRQPNGKYLVDFDASAKVGRIYVATPGLPPNATVLNAEPFAGMAVTEIAPNRVRALFDLENGTYTISSIFPIYVP
jgi:hypothetical protein